ncbi:hypothetical protein [Niveispirillum fermenti]|uniref:hypothetical protein n=1 Tax=Niveispirillum fermenti TaxID=1233113 RepID=UPI003A86DACD
MDGGAHIRFIQPETCQPEAEGSFAQLYRLAHAKAGLARLGVSNLLDWLTRRGGDAAGLDLLLEDGRPLTPDNRDRVKGNIFLSFLFHDLRHRLLVRMDQARIKKDGPFAPLPPGLSQDQKLNWLRSQCCLTLNLVLDEWAAEMADRPVSGCPFARMARFAQGFFKGSALYARAGHDMVSISKTGSNTALHMCFSLVEASLHLGVDLPVADWRDAMWRSRKELKTLAAGSLGMIVTFLHASRLEPEGESAVNPTTGEACAFRVEQGVDGLRLRLDSRPITPFTTGHDRLYTGCPAFHVGGMIEMYLDWVLDLAAHHGLHAPERLPVPALRPQADRLAAMAMAGDD